MTVPGVGGRKKIERAENTAAQVLTMAGFGLTLLEIAKVVGMSQPTLHKLYRPELDRGHIVANAKVAHSLFTMATHPTKPNVSAAIFWAKVRMGWRESGRRAHRPERGGKGKS